MLVKYVHALRPTSQESGQCHLLRRTATCVPLKSPCKLLGTVFHTQLSFFRGMFMAKALFFHENHHPHQARADASCVKDGVTAEQANIRVTAPRLHTHSRSCSIFTAAHAMPLEGQD